MTQNVTTAVDLDLDFFQQCMGLRSSMNFRERCRMKKLNQAFLLLKSKLPWIPADSKLTKLEILRYAIDYIRHLTILLQYQTEVAIS